MAIINLSAAHPPVLNLLLQLKKIKYFSSNTQGLSKVNK